MAWYSISKEAKTDFKKWAGHIIIYVLGAYNVLLFSMLVNAGYPGDVAGFIIGLYAAFSLGATFMVSKYWGSFTQKDIDSAVNAAVKNMRQTGDFSKQTLKANEEQADLIEAAQQKITIEVYKKNKYGDSEYDYGRSEAKKKAAAENLKKANAMAKQAKIDLGIISDPEALIPDGK